MEPCRLYENHWLACMAAVGGGRVTRLQGGLVLTTPRVSGAFLNFAVLRECPADLLPFTLEASAALLAENGEPPALFLSPDAGDATALSRSLLDRGWHPVVRQVVLQCDLPITLPTAPEKEEADASRSTGDAEVDTQSIDRDGNNLGSGVDENSTGIEVEAVCRAGLQEWVQTLARAYGSAPDRGLTIARAWATLSVAPGEGSQALLCLARIGGRPAGTGIAWTQGSLAALYCGAVLPTCRRRGIERTTMLYRLRWAAEMGCQQAMLQTEAGSPVEHLCVDRLGFRRAYHRVLWAPAGHG